MKLTALRLTIAVAALLAAVSTASAQNLKAEIPFSFEARGVHMLPGAYTVTLNRSSGAVLAEIYNVDQRKAVIAMPRVSESPGKLQSSTATLTFACTEGHCELMQLRDTGATVYRFNTSKPTAATHIATVLLRSDRGE